jgi:hypothetical protein
LEHSAAVHHAGAFFDCDRTGPVLCRRRAPTGSWRAPAGRWAGVGAGCGLRRNVTAGPLRVKPVPAHRDVVQFLLRDGGFRRAWTRHSRELAVVEWIKQHLRIKAFYGTSENAVKNQIWIAISVNVLVAIVRKRLGLEMSLYQILQILSITLFEKTSILQALQPSTPRTNYPTPATS